MAGVGRESRSDLPNGPGTMPLPHPKPVAPRPCCVVVLCHHANAISDNNRGARARAPAAIILYIIMHAPRGARRRGGIVSLNHYN
eukprot:SAG31_NODE_46500_length_254_cov_0.670968_1_plen_84_part_11